MRLLPLAMILLLAACTPSLQPLYTEKDVVFDPALLGIWRDVKDAKIYFVATRGANNACRILQIEDNSVGRFTATLVKLRDTRFVDLYPDEPPAGFYWGHFVRSHTFARIDVKDNRLTLGHLDPDWFKTEEASGAAVKPILLGDQPLLLQSTAQLQEFALKYSNTKAFGAASEWIRER